MYLSEDLIIGAIRNLESLHPFFGVTFLACKQNRLPVEESVEFPINSFETLLLERYYKPIKETEKFFRIFRSSDKAKYWLNSDYASSGSQATRTQHFSDVFIHPKNSNMWGWRSDYIETLSKHLPKNKIPIFYLCVWLFRDVNWPDDSNESTLINKFIQDFNITQKEFANLFEMKVPKLENMFASRRANWDNISEKLGIPLPPDMPTSTGGSLVSLYVKNVGNVNFELGLHKRLNIITGDNGLGKSFILECAWWALTNTWTGFPLYPNLELSTESRLEPEISFQISNRNGRVEKYKGAYDWRSQNWQLTAQSRKTVSGLIIYARVDGAFAVWDPARRSGRPESEPAHFVFTREEIWNGVHLNDGHKSRSIFNGLITDWVHWQNSNSRAYEILKKILVTLSPPDLRYGDLGILVPGATVRIPGESRPIPTIRHPYGEVPITHASAAVKRIIALAYLIVWTWEEHTVSSTLNREEPESNMVVIADEIEAHLHPQWQRVILPALVNISNDLSPNLNIQYLITTHSPLVMASLESLYQDDSDKIVHLNMVHQTQAARVILEELPFQRRGTANSWLTSELFDLRQPTSFEAEQIIEEAKKLQNQSNPDKTQIRKISEQLLSVLPPHDTFWVRWNHFAEKNGIAIDE